MSDSSNILSVILITVLIFIGLIVLFMQYKKTKGNSTKDALFGNNIDEQLQAQFKAVLLGQSVILEKNNYDAFIEQKVKLQQQENLNNELKAQQQQLNTDLKQLQQNSKELEIQLKQKLSSAENYQKTAEQQLTTLIQEKTALQQKNEELQQELIAHHTKIAQLESQKQSLEQMRTADQERFAAEQQDLEHRLNSIGEKFLQERGDSLNKLNNEKMNQIIDPLRQELTTFRELIVTTQKNNSEYAGKLITELQHLQNAQNALSTQADQLTQALLQGNKSQGMWGELQLERVLEMAGLEKHLQYLREQSGINSTNQKIRMDVVIPLPRDHSIIVDAKCSLSAYTDLVNAELNSDSNAYQDALKRHIISIKHHVDELAAKDYQTAVGLKSPDFVFMFVPIDQALAVALKAEPTLYEYAQKKNIALISPSIAVPALRIVSELWISELQSRRLEDLATMADKIYQKSCTVCKIFEKVLKDSENLTKDIDSLNTSLYQGRGNLLRMLENFKKDAPALTSRTFNEIQQDLKANSAVALPEQTNTSIIVAPSVKRCVNKQALTMVAINNAIKAPTEPAADPAIIEANEQQEKLAPELTPEELEKAEIAIMKHAAQQIAQSHATLGINKDVAPDHSTINAAKTKRA